MDGLRLILIVMGVIILALIYFLGVRRQRRDADDVFGPAHDAQDDAHDPLFAPRGPGGDEDLNLDGWDGVRADRADAIDDGLSLDDWQGPPLRSAKSRAPTPQAEEPDGAKAGAPEPPLAGVEANSSANEALPLRPASTQAQSAPVAPEQPKPREPRRRVNIDPADREGFADVVSRAIALDGDGLFDETSLKERQIDFIESGREPDTQANEPAGAASPGPSPADSVDKLDSRLQELAEVVAQREGDNTPEIGDLSDVEVSAASGPIAASGDGISARAQKKARAHQPEEFLVVLNVMSKTGAPFTGVEIAKALDNAGMRHGEMEMFHYQRPAPRVSDDQPPLFSAANALRPGTLALDELPTLSTPGIAFFMRIDDARTASDDFKTMLRVAQMVAARLGGSVCDESRTVLTNQSINHLKEKIGEFCRHNVGR